jgi:hypothetical protein
VNYWANPVFYIGATKREYGGTVVQYGNFLLDDFTIWNTVLADSSIKSVSYSSDQFTGKYLPEDFSEGLEFLYTGKNLSNTLYDQSGKGANATLANVSAGSANLKGFFPLTHWGTSNIDLTNAPNAYMTTGNWSIGILFTPSVAGTQFLFACDNNTW